MVVLSINGRLGNQMFGFALHQYLKDIGKDVFVDLACNRSNGEQGLWSDIKYNAGLFNLNYRIADENIVKDMLADGRGRNIWRRWKYRIIPSRCRYYEEKKQGTFDKKIYKLDDVYLHGYWQTEKYFVRASDEVRRMYRFPDLYTDYQKYLLDKITTERAASVHVRRGDYLMHPEIYGTTDLKYYKRAMEYVRQRRENVRFYVFTDDIPWAKENFKGNDIIVIENTGGSLLTSNLDMALMAECKDNIIANSSFSWWAAWLNGNPNKIVIAPRIWEADKVTKDIWCKDWIRM